jgi:hypothetical protein
MSALKMKRGDTRQFQSTGVTRGGLPVNLTGATIRFTAKFKRTDAQASAVISKSTATGGVTIISATAGTYHVTILPSDTSSLAADRSLYYDVEMLETDGTVTTIDEGTLSITLDVST